MLKNASYVITKLRDPDNLAKPAQVGVDLTVNRIYEIASGIRSAGTVYRETTELAVQRELLWPEDQPIYLSAGTAYAIEFDQGLDALEADETAFIIQRSSLNRNGCMLVGSVFDPGFYTEKLGATLYAFSSLGIERHARLAQLLIAENESVLNKYNGQFQGKVGS